MNVIFKEERKTLKPDPFFDPLFPLTASVFTILMSLPMRFMVDTPNPGGCQCEYAKLATTPVTYDCSPIEYARQQVLGNVTWVDWNQAYLDAVVGVMRNESMVKRMVPMQVPYKYAQADERKSSTPSPCRIHPCDDTDFASSTLTIRRAHEGRWPSSISSFHSLGRYAQAPMLRVSGSRAQRQ